MKAKLANTENEENLQQRAKELVKPRKLDSALIREVESLCGELERCDHLRRLEGDNVEQGEDILF